MRFRSRRGGQGFLAFLAWGVALLVTLTFGWILTSLVQHGLDSVSYEFLVETPQDAGRSGGIAPILVSTLLLLATCLTIAVPVSLGSAAFLAEIVREGGRTARLVRSSLDLLATVPSIVFGLFGAVFFGRLLGLGFSLLSGGLTLACMVLPIMIRSTEAGFRSVPDELRLGAAALGLTRFATLRHLLLPAALPGLVVGLVLGIGRALAETAALLFTSGYVTRMPSSLFDSGRSLSVHIYDLAMNVPGGEGNAWASALVLVVVLGVLHLTASAAADRWIGGSFGR